MAAIELPGTTQKIVENIRTQVISRAERIANRMRTEELKVLTGPRHGRLYPIPGRYTKRKRKDKVSGLKTHLTYYRASAPGESPANRTGALRQSFARRVISTTPDTVEAALESGLKYAKLLEDGTKRMAPRPYFDKIIEATLPFALELLNKRYK